LKKAQNEDQPLMTKAMRDLEQDKKAMKYSQVVIRIAFKNRQVLQGFFRPKETISALYTFVRDNISKDLPADDAKDFYLFQTPPKIVLNNMKKSLFESQLCPATLIHCDRVLLLKRELYDNLTTLSHANELVRVNVHEQMRDIRHEGMDLLEREERAKGKLLKSLIKAPNNNNLSESQSTYENRQRQEQTSQRSDHGKSSDVNKKLERFLKGSKK
jgi:hypothetical protein